MSFPKIAMGSILVLVFLFCVYGFMASREPLGDSSIRKGWMISYSLMGLSALGGAIVLFRSKPKEH